MSLWKRWYPNQSENFPKTPKDLPEVDMNNRVCVEDLVRKAEWRNPSIGCDADVAEKRIL